MSEVSDPLNEPELRQRASYPFWVQDQVRWADTDMVGHVNNLAFIGFCETGRSLLLREVLGQGTVPVLAEIRLKFLREAHWPADIDIGTGVTQIGTRSFRLGQALFDGERCIAVAESAMVLIDEVTRRPCELTPVLRAWLDGRQLQRS